MMVPEFMSLLAGMAKWFLVMQQNLCDFMISQHHSKTFMVQRETTDEDTVAAADFVGVTFCLWGEK